MQRNESTHCWIVKICERKKFSKDYMSETIFAKEIDVFSAT